MRQRASAHRQCVRSNTFKFYRGSLLSFFFFILSVNCFSRIFFFSIPRSKRASRDSAATDRNRFDFFLLFVFRSFAIQKEYLAIITMGKRHLIFSICVWHRWSINFMFEHLREIQCEFKVKLEHFNIDTHEFYWNRNMPKCHLPSSKLPPRISHHSSSSVTRSNTSFLSFFSYFSVCLRPSCYHFFCCNNVVTQQVLMAVECHYNMY